MKTLPRRNGSLLFLTELLISILVLAVAAAFCVKLFADAREMRQKSAAITQAAVLAQNAAEVFKEKDGALEAFFGIKSGEVPMDGVYSMSYDAQGIACEKEQAAYVLMLCAAEQNGLSVADISVHDAGGEALFALRAAALREDAP